MTDSTGLEFRLLSGKTGRVVAHSPKRTTVVSPEPSPPGSTVRGTIPGLSSPFEVKVRDCRRLSAEGHFVIEGRLQNARRELLERLAGVDPEWTSGGE